jgi:hypothetical protein
MLRTGSGRAMKSLMTMMMLMRKTTPIVSRTVHQVSMRNVLYLRNVFSLSVRYAMHVLDHVHRSDYTTPAWKRAVQSIMGRMYTSSTQRAFATSSHGHHVHAIRQATSASLPCCIEPGCTESLSPSLCQAHADVLVLGLTGPYTVEVPLHLCSKHVSKCMRNDVH